MQITFTLSLSLFLTLTHTHTHINDLKCDTVTTVLIILCIQSHGIWSFQVVTSIFPQYRWFALPPCWCTKQK